METNCENAMCFGKVRSEFHDVLSNANRFTPSLNSKIKTRDGEQPFRIIAKLSFHILRRFKCGCSLAAQIEIHRDLRNDAREQLVRDTDIRLVNRSQQLFGSACDVSLFQLLIAERCMSADQ